MNKGKNIMICPLEWGLGHAGRMIPFAAKLLESGNNVFIAAGSEHISFFKSELAGLSYIHFPGFKPGYSRMVPQYIALLVRLPVLICRIIAEHYRLKKIISENNIDIVISDNRFGLWNKKIKTVYITHQPLIPFPEKMRFLEWTGILLHRSIIKRYSLCFIPDLPGENNLTGRLSHGLKLPSNTVFTGILSRFSDKNESGTDKTGKNVFCTVILSGPEPQRSILRDKIRRVLSDDKNTSVILEGHPGSEPKESRSGNLVSYNHLPAHQMRKMIDESEHIISRSGYTTIMELVSMRRSALIIPTPGQTEQEYLAAYLSEKGWFTTLSQDDLKRGINLPFREITDIDELLNESRELLDKALENLLKEN